MSGRIGFASVVATGRGDDGTTGLLFDDVRVQKDDLRTEAFGTVDEAVAALGLVRAELSAKELRGGRTPTFVDMGSWSLRIERELLVVGAELATAPESRHKQSDGVSRVSKAILDGIEAMLRASEASIELPASLWCRARPASLPPWRCPAQSSAARNAAQ